MNHKSSPNHTDDLEAKIKKLVSFEPAEGTSGSSQKPSKYARVLTCSFVRTAGVQAPRRKKEPKMVCFPDSTIEQEASIK